jgi:hypothetical protein
LFVSEQSLAPALTEDRSRATFEEAQACVAEIEGIYLRE